MGRQWGVLFEVRHLMLEPLEAHSTSTSTLHTSAP